MHWNWIRYDNGLNHATPYDLIGAVQEDMRQRTPPGILRDVSLIDGITIDRPGMCCMDRPIEKFEFLNLSICIPCDDLLGLVSLWNEVPAVTSLGKTFHRFVGHPWRCLVVASMYRDGLLDLLRARVSSAEARAHEFFVQRGIDSR